MSIHKRHYKSILSYYLNILIYKMQHGMQIFMLFSNRWYDFHIYEYLFPLVLVMEHHHIPFSSQKNPNQTQWENQSISQMRKLQRVWDNMSINIKLALPWTKQKTKANLRKIYLIWMQHQFWRHYWHNKENTLTWENNMKLI